MRELIAKIGTANVKDFLTEASVISGINLILFKSGPPIYIF